MRPSYLVVLMLSAATTTALLPTMVGLIVVFIVVW
jgi:hypothetical protein